MISVYKIVAGMANRVCTITIIKKKDVSNIITVSKVASTEQALQFISTHQVFSFLKEICLYRPLRHISLYV